MSLGVYVHFPWCRKRCPYCDFAIAIAPLDEVPHRPYARAVADELAARAPSFEDAGSLVSIYFGGGTPGLWEVGCLADLIGDIRARFSHAGKLEVTLEVNPTDCRPSTLDAWLAAGINRLSIGVQSFDPGELRVLGRDHRFGDGRAAVAAARAAGFNRLSVDIILGTPAAGARHGLDAVRAAAELAPDHLSVYELTIEERTPFAAAVRRGDVATLDDDELAELYLAVDENLTGCGYEHYEISSYARPGCRAVHNSLYWHGGSYLGLGNGAASFQTTAGGGGVRVTNLRSVVAYLAAPAGERAAEIDRSTAEELRAEQLWLALRTSDGADESALDAFPGLADSLLGDRLARRQEGRIRPTIRGFLYADMVASRVVAHANARVVAS